MKGDKCKLLIQNAFPQKLTTAMSLNLWEQVTCWCMFLYTSFSICFVILCWHVFIPHYNVHFYTSLLLCAVFIHNMSFFCISSYIIRMYSYSLWLACFDCLSIHFQVLYTWHHVIYQVIHWEFWEAPGKVGEKCVPNPIEIWGWFLGNSTSSLVKCYEHNWPCSGFGRLCFQSYVCHTVCSLIISHKLTKGCYTRNLLHNSFVQCGILM